MAKTLDANQQQKIDRRFLQPVYFVHILNVGVGAETLYFSDRTFKYNGHDYEGYLTELPALAQSIERFGGYLNINAQLAFKNQRFRAPNTLLEWFDANPITRKELELYALYIDTGETFGADVSTKLCRLGIGEFKQITRQTFQADLCTIAHLLDQKNVLYRINTTDWPNADPKVVGQPANIVYGSVKDIPCQCIKTGAYSTLREDMTATKIGVPLSEVTYPMDFPASGTVYVEDEQIDYSEVQTSPPKLVVKQRGANGTVAAAHKAGSPVIVKLANYKWMAAGHIMKAVSAVKVDRVLMPDTDYTINLNDSGRTTITFSERKILKHQGSHDHPSKATKTWFANKAGCTTSPASFNINWTPVGLKAYAVDQDGSTAFQVKGTPYSPPLAATESVKVIMTFPAYSGQTPAAVYLCVTHRTTQFGTVCRSNLISPQPIRLDYSGVQKTEKLKLSGITVPTSVTFQLSMPAGATIGDGITTAFFEVWIEIETAKSGVSAAGGVFGRMDDVFAPLVTVDGEGYKDTAGGTYTGSANALIENPSDVRRHFLMAVLGRSAADLATTEFDAMRTTYANRITGGYKVATLLNRLAETPSEILRVLDYETRSMLREDGGLFHLAFNEAAAPTSVLTIDKDHIYGEPVFGQTPIDEVRNSFRALHDIDWGQGRANNHYLSEFMKSTAASDATSITKYGELTEDVEFRTAKKTTQVDDVLAWLLSQQKDVLKTVTLEADHVARVLEKGDYFILTWDFWSGLKWRVLSIDENPATQGYRIEAVQYPV